MSKHIKTGVEIYNRVYHRLEQDTSDESIIEEKWISLNWLEKQIQKKLKELPLNTSSDWIENKSAKEILNWILLILKEDG